MGLRISETDGSHTGRMGVSGGGMTWGMGAISDLPLQVQDQEPASPNLPVLSIAGNQGVARRGVGAFYSSAYLEQHKEIVTLGVVALGGLALWWLLGRSGSDYRFRR